MPSITAALHDLLAAHELTVDEALTRHVTDDYRQSTDGDWIDRAAFAAHLTGLRAAIDAVEFEVLSELTQGDAYAERHIVTITLRDGSRRRQEVYLFAQLAADGRFARLEELTRPLPIA